MPSDVATPGPAPTREGAVKVKSGQRRLWLVVHRSAKVPVFGYTASGAKVSLTWKSSKPKVVKVSKAGKITGLKRGRATVWAKAANGKKATITVTVVARSSTARVARVSAKVPKTMAVGKVAWVTGAYGPPKVRGVIVRYSSTKKSVATIDKAGRLVAKAKGTAKIRIRAKGKVKTYKLKVR